MNTTPSEVTDAGGRRIAIQVPDAGDQFDLIELAGAQSANQMWMMRAMAVWSASSIDGVPLPRPTTAREIKANARTLGDAGIFSIMEALWGNAAKAGEATPDAVAATAKN